MNATDVPALTDEEKRLLVRMFHVQKIMDDEIVFVNKATGWQNAVWTGAIWMVGQAVMVAGWLLRWDLRPPPTDPWYLYPVLVLLGLPIIAVTVRRADRAQRSVILQRGEPAVTVRLCDREWRVLLPGGFAPTQIGFSSATIPWRHMELQTRDDQQSAAELLVRFTAARENRRPSETWLHNLEEAGVDVVGFDAESVSISGAGNVRPKQVMWGVFATWGSIWAFMAAFLLGLAGALAFPRGFQLFDVPPSSFAVWTIFWLVSLPGPFMLVWEMSPYNVMTFWRGKNAVTLYAEGKSVPWNCGVRPQMIRQESLGGDPGGNVTAADLAWGCSPQLGHGEFLVDYLREILKPEELRKPELTL